MLDLELMRAVAEQMMRQTEVILEGTKLSVEHTGHSRLRTVRFQMNGREYQAIEQNATKPSRWGELARQGHRVVQFKDVETNRYVGVSVDGKVKEYGRSA